jgi:hypothetical protein
MFSDKTMGKNNMRRLQRVVLLTAFVAIAPVLAGCENFDMDKLDVFGLNEKKKLPGDRKPLFPEGVPGVSQGIPPEFMKGNRPAENAEITPLPAEPPRSAAAGNLSDEPKPKAKRKPKVAKQKLIPDASPPPAQAQQPGLSPAPNQQQPEPAPQQSSSAPWPGR